MTPVRTRMLGSLILSYKERAFPHFTKPCSLICLRKQRFLRVVGRTCRPTPQISFEGYSIGEVVVVWAFTGGFGFYSLQEAELRSLVDTTASLSGRRLTASPVDFFAPISIGGALSTLPCCPFM